MSRPSRGRSVGPKPRPFTPSVGPKARSRGARPRKTPPRAPPIPWDQLFAAASQARQQAYAPYSRFAVGAAVFCDDGSVIAGCNVENASYGLSLCAERSALARMVLEGKQRLKAVAIVVDTPRPTPPCGMCRQAMREFGEPGVLVRSKNLQGKEDRRTLGELLPNAFTRDFL